MAGIMAAVKGLGWDFIKLTKAGFDGAVQSYKSDKGNQVAVCFTINKAYVIDDEDGLFSVSDLTGLIKDEDFDMLEPNDIDDTVTLASIEGKEVTFDDAALEKYGINDFSVKESITNRLVNLVELGAEEILKLN